MGWNGSGQYTRDNGVNTGSGLWTADRDASTKILASRHDVHDENIATGLENCVTRDGQNSPSNDLPMATYKHTDVGLSSALTQYARTDQVQKQSFCYGGTTGGTTTYALTLSPAPAAYSAGLSVRVQFNATSAASPTLNVNALGVANIYAGSVAAPAGTFRANQFYDLVHDGSTGFYLVSDYQSLTTWAPTYGCGGAMTIGTVTTSVSKYIERNGIVELFLDFDGTTAGVSSNSLTFTLPVSALGGAYNSLSCVARDGGGTAFGGVCIVSGATGNIYRYDNAGWGIGAGRGAWISGSYIRA